VKKRTQASFSSFFAMAFFLLAQSVYALQEGDFQYEVNEADPATVTITDYSGNGGDLEIPSTLAGKTVTTIGSWAFHGNIDLTSVSIPEGVTSIGSSAFKDCAALTSVTLSDSLITIGDQVFKNCTALRSVIIPDSVTYIGEAAFGNCSALESVTISKGVRSIIQNPFYGCVNLKSIDVDAQNTRYSSIDGIFFNKPQTRLILYPAGRTKGTYTIPASVTSIDSEAFNDCVNLNSIDVDAQNTAYSSIDGILFNKLQTKLIQYPAGRTKGTYTIPKGVTSIGDAAFKDCTALTSVTIPDSVKSIGYAAFKNCTALKTVTLPNSLKSMGYEAFSYCASLTSVTIPDSITSISDETFSYCASLTSVTIPDSVTSIGYYAFSYCDSLMSVTIPDSVTSIGGGAFQDCDHLNSIYFQGDAPRLGTEAFIGSNKLSAVYYLKAAEESFEETYGKIETKLWDPLIQDRASDFGIQSSGAFAFDIKAEGINGAQVKVESTKDLLTWETEVTYDITRDDHVETFTDDLANSHSKRFYRLNMP
jgi:hypothetical protein